SRRSRPSRAPSAPGTRATRSRTGPLPAPLPAVAGDRDQLAKPRLELLLARPLEPLAQHLEDLRLRAAVYEDDEAEAELLLVDLVEVRKLGQDHRVGVGALLGGRALRQAGAHADRRMR